MQTILWHVRMATGLGAIFVALSEVAFYPLTLAPDLAIVVVFYAVAAHASVLAVAMSGGGGALAFFVVAACVGLLVEGIPVFELYTALPFTIVWTSLAWHGVVSGFIGVALYRLALARGGWVAVLTPCLLGAGLGLWGAYYWTVEPGGEGYGPQILIATLLFGVGHALLPSGHVPMPLRRTALGGSVLLCLVSYAGAALVAFFPVALVLPVCLAVCLWAVRGYSQGQPLWSQVPLKRHLMGLAIPVCALGVFDVAEGAAWITEMSAIVLALFGPLSVILIGLAAWRARRPGLG